MSIKPICDLCKKELDKPGAILFGPPVKPPINIVGCWCEKFHICCECFNKLIIKIKQ